MGAITCVEITSTSGSTQTSVPVTFGQPFRAGDWQHLTHGLVAKVDDAVVPVQADEISSHRDGSARFAVVSTKLTNLQPGQTKIVNLYLGNKTNVAPTVPADPDWNLEIETQVYDANGNVTATLIAQPQAQLKSQIAANSGRRLGGPVAAEYTVVSNFKDKISGVVHPHLTARLHTRLVDAGARIRTDVVMENTRTWTAAPGNITYSMVVKRNGVAIHTQPKFTHYHHARWHKVVWTGSSAQPQARVRHHMPYFMASKAVWNYDLNITVPETTLSALKTSFDQKRTEQASLGPMGNSMLATYFGTTGGRGEIGPLPLWTVLYLLSQDDRAREVMMAIGDSAASVPVHYRDEASDLPIDLDAYPRIAIRFGTSTPALPTVQNGSTIWSVDTAHQGSYAYVPYIVTGDKFYLEESMFWAAWNLASDNPALRNYGDGLIKNAQVRGQAWMLRSIGEASRIAPDNHPQKAYFMRKLQVNLDWYAANYPNHPNAKALYPLNALPKPDEPHLTSPWQNDFMMLVFSLLAENGDPKAAETLSWLSGFSVERFRQEPNGFCIAKAPGSYFNTRSASGTPTTSWRELFSINWPTINSCDGVPIEPISYPDTSGGYAAYARAMLAAATNAGVSNAASTYTAWKATTAIIDSKYSTNPTWAIVPRQR